MSRFDNINGDNVHRPKFTCHAITDPHPYNGGTVGWVIVGEGRFYKNGFLDGAKDRVRLEYPNAEFTESFSVHWGEEQHLRGGVEAYWTWWRAHHRA